MVQEVRGSTPVSSKTGEKDHLQDVSIKHGYLPLASYLLTASDGVDNSRS
jgi:hypothetical protein